MIEERIPLIEEILGERRDELGDDYLGYRNHVYRMVHFCFALYDINQEEREKVLIAGCFHDLGIWTDSTFDYLPPSVALATAYLTRNKLERWIPEIGLMIDMHHRVRKYPAGPAPLVEVFRKGDLVDFSLGFVKCGVSSEYIKTVKTQFPNAGFHKQLLRLAARWICQHPLNPVPVLKW